MQKEFSIADWEVVYNEDKYRTLVASGVMGHFF